MAEEVNADGSRIRRRFQTVQERCLGELEEAVSNQIPKYVTQARASFILGMPEEELFRISQESGLGRVERFGNEEETYFTYDELQAICMLALHQEQPVH